MSGLENLSRVFVLYGCEFYKGTIIMNSSEHDILITNKL